MASGDAAGTVLLLEVDTGRILRREHLGGSRVNSLVFLNGGRSLLVGQDHGAVSLYALDRSGPLRSVTLRDGCTRLVVDRRGERAMVGDSKGSLLALSLPDLVVVHRLEMGHEDAIKSLALSPDGRLLATAGKDRRVVLRDPDTFRALLTLPNWTAPLQDVAFDGTGRWLAFAGVDSEIALWDLGLVRDELAAVGLAWDQSASGVVPRASPALEKERPSSSVPLILPGNLDLAELEKALGLVSTGVAALQQGRYADAAGDLQQARKHLEALRRVRPTDTILASLHGMSLGFLGSASRELKRSGEALAHFRESLAVLESMFAPQSIDLYNMACDCAMVSALDVRLSPEDREKLRTRAVAYLRSVIEQDRLGAPTRIAEDRDLDPLRDRADFRGLMADTVFPRNPFASPSPLSRTAPETHRAGDVNHALAHKNEGHALLGAGRTLEGLSVLSAALASTPEDTFLLLEVAALQAWFGRDAEFAVTCRWALEFARDTHDPAVADRTAKVCCLRPSEDKTRCDAALALARRAVTLGKDHEWLPYFQMALGMAEYRSGHDTAADKALLAAADSGRENDLISGTSAFYRAMSLFRQGKHVEARRIASEAAVRMRPLPGDEKNPLTGGAGADDLILWMAYKEAKALLRLDAAPASTAKPKGE
jgi:tetratricopeptide (TPR) repeat protein